LQRGQNGTNNNSTAGNNYALPCGTAKQIKLCKNTQLTCRKRRKLLIGKSDIHGWGAFANEEIQKNEFITEYTGELISQQEAERRGRVYDGMNSNFLFSLNDNFAVDSTRKGNKV
jgi:histone-lysine N-methyltransferase EZH2